MSYYLLDQSMWDSDFREQRALELPSTAGATYCAMEEERKLIFAVDDSRIKSFAWGGYTDRSETGATSKKALPVHTLNSHYGSSRPLDTLRSYTIVSCGLVGASLGRRMEQHVPGSNKTIGGRINVSNTWREYDSMIEPSARNRCHTAITLGNRDIISIGA
ncbi:hypothetical protein BS17DRAFT_147081 [Gyrodon lividus]|nr:hypothetical protein BS17DRAFT_147081 [Gyrodon lividus]